MNVLHFFALFFLFATTSTAAKITGLGRGRMALEFMKRHQRREEDPDKPQSRNARHRGSQDPSRTIIARKFLVKNLPLIPVTTTKSPAQIEQESKAKDPKNVKEAMEKFARKIHKLAKDHLVGQRCTQNEPDCPKNQCCMKKEGQMYGTCQRFPTLLGQCTKMCGCNHNAAPGSQELECRHDFVAGVASSTYKRSCVAKTEPISADVLSLRKLSGVKLNKGHKSARKHIKQLPLKLKKVKKQQSQSTSS